MNIQNKCKESYVHYLWSALQVNKLAIFLKFMWHIFSEDLACVLREVSCCYRHIMAFNALPFPSELCLSHKHTDAYTYPLTYSCSAMVRKDIIWGLGRELGGDSHSGKSQFPGKTSSCQNTKWHLRCMESQDNNQNILCCWPMFLSYFVSFY